MKADLVVVGGGAAGIFAAWRAASLGVKVVILEKTVRLGTKILVSGGGKCNITHSGSVEQVLKAFRPNEARFLRPSFYRLLPTQVVDMFTSQGLEVYTRPDGRIFPVDKTAKDVVEVLRGHLDRVGVRVEYETQVVGLDTLEGGVVGVRFRRRQVKVAQAVQEVEGYRAATAKNLLRELGDDRSESPGEIEQLVATRVIVSTGGSSYPNSGTTGDGFGWARDIGHKVMRVRAALAPIYLDWIQGMADLSGVSLRDITLKAKQGKEVARWRGDFLFTHQGVSGPSVLGISRAVEERRLEDSRPVSLEIDLAPDESFEQVSAKFLEAGARPHRKVASPLSDFVPERLCIPLLVAANVDPELTFARLDRKGRNRLVEVVKGWPLGSVRHVPLEKGEVVAGGISLDEVDPHSMKSDRIHGLWLCGEVLDIAGPVGGYNLQAAFATGYVAGESVAREMGLLD